jgi:hypothetical protein
MKSFQAYYYESKKIFEFRIKIAANDLDAKCQKQIREALEAFKLETITAPKRLPIQEHRDFPKVGPCECYVVDVGLAYPTVPEQILQLVVERCGLTADCICVFPLDQYLFNEEFEAHGKDHEGALLDDPELAFEKDAQSFAGQQRIDGLIKELSKISRKYDIAGKDKTDGKTVVTTGKTTNDFTIGTKAPVGSKQQNKIPSPVKGR